ncbi:hypothetical protein [Thiohalocapsa sp. ML1]|uniref:hypothetical protein n=1 Tax=Thiohalocapsa sp. ML1 TaxID=1431688 RepID=UPI000731FE6F|nr:hypothetical protein [Thiohalocapsa sp. ML1]
MNHGKRMTKLGLAAAAVGLGMGNAHAVPQPYTNFSDFENALATSGLIASRQGFDGIAADTPINNGDTLVGFTFTDISLESGQLAVVEPSDSPETRSQSNAIGTSWPADQQMRNPDSFTLTFPTPSYAFGIWFIAESGFAEDDDFSISLPGVTNSPSQGSVAANGVPLNTNFSSWFIGFIDATSPFTTAVIASTDVEDTGTFLFRVDDVYTAQRAPAPSSLLLLALGAGILGFHWRAASQHRV